MIVFGTLRSLFDLLTFAELMFGFRVDADHFRTAWFIESIVSAALVVLIVRTQRPLWRSTPNRWLLLATIITIIVSIGLPWTPVAGLMGLRPLPAPVLATIAWIVLGYVLSAELAKAWYYRSLLNGPTVVAAHEYVCTATPRTTLLLVATFFRHHRSIRRCYRGVEPRRNSATRVTSAAVASVA